ncbi:MAG TPA: phosphoglucosamine mutase [Blastocatellia bacterium]|nr:phosphoglucosamine mutase [Blastocatellia bacterium]
MGEFFGTDGIRGVAGQYPLDSRTITGIGYSLARELESRLGHPPMIIIGRDTRESGEWIEAAIAHGVHLTKARTQSAGIITTPGVAYLTRALGAQAGIVISASHNSYQDNGIKIFAPSGQKLDDALEQAIERDLKAGTPDLPEAPDRRPEPDASLATGYLAFLRDQIGRGLNLNGLRITVDCANGAAYDLAPQLLASLGAELTTINAQPTGQNINRDCGSLYPDLLQRAVIETKSDLGLAFDGDADRLMIIDEGGQLVDGDLILFIMADYFLAQGNLSGNRVVATVMSNLGLELALKERGVKLVRTSVGDKYVLDELLKGGGSIGGEQSGHIIFPEISLAGDGLITALEVLRAMVESKKTLRDLSRGFKRYPQITINVQVSSKPQLESVPAITEVIAAVERELGGKGRLLVRYSGTENKARVMIEGEDQSIIRSQAERITQVIQAELG